MVDKSVLIIKMYLWNIAFSLVNPEIVRGLFHDKYGVSNVTNIS